MGAAGAKEDLLRRDEIQDLEEMSGFSGDEIVELYGRFIKLDRAGTGTLTKDDLMRIPELSMNPLAERVIAHFGFSQSSRINFADFLKLLQVFRKRTGEREDQLRVIFNIFDKTQDSFITSKELHEVLKGMVGSNMSDQDLENIVKIVIEEADADGDGKISYAEFCTCMFDENLENLTVRSWEQIN